MIKNNAPAKINLTLEVLGKRADGFHEIKSVVQTIDLYDTLTIGPAEQVTFECDMPGWSAEKSLLKKVVDALGVTKGAKIKIAKRIPMMAGLGGDSSDAAALLKGLNELWKLKLSVKRLKETAEQIGSDVPFFIEGGTALMEGRGEKLTRLPPPLKPWFVLVVPDAPDAPGKTARMYAALKKQHFTDGKITRRLVSALHNKDFDESLLFNTFENVAYNNFPRLKACNELLTKLGATRVRVAGSGPALFSLFKEINKAEVFYQRCIGQRLKAYLTSSI